MNHRNDQQGRQRGAQNGRNEGRQNPSKMRPQEWREGRDDRHENGGRNHQWSQRGGEEGYYRDGGEFQRGGNEQSYPGRVQGRNQSYAQGGYGQGQDRGGQYRGDEEYGRWDEGRQAGQGREREEWQGMSSRNDEYAPRYQNRGGARDWQGYERNDYRQDRYAGHGYGSAPQAGQYNPSPEDDYRPMQYWGGGDSYGRTGRGPSGYASEQGYGGNNRGQASQSYGDSGAGYDQGFASDAQGYSGSGYSGSQGKSHRGMGPKNYMRSDERLREDINEKLTDAPWLDASEINVQAKDGKITLEGSVSERHLKHKVEDLVDRCYGVKDIDNRLTVRSANQGSSTNQGAPGSGTEDENGQGKRGKTQQH